MQAWLFSSGGAEGAGGVAVQVAGHQRRGSTTSPACGGRLGWVGGLLLLGLVTVEDAEKKDLGLFKSACE